MLPGSIVVEDSDWAPRLPDLRRRYSALNQGFTRTRIQQVGTGAGFGAEAVGLLKSMIACLSEGTKLVVGCHPHGRGFTLGHGWGDYFVSPFPILRTRRLDLLNRAQYPGQAHWPKPLLRSAHAATRTLLRADLLQFDAPRLPPRLEVPALGLDFDWWSGCKLCLDLIWDFQADVADEITRFQEALDLDGAYGGVHLRRGDKSAEAALVDLERYARAIEATPGVPETIVVASDDGSAPPRLRELLGSAYRVIDLSSDTERGHFQGEFNGLPRHVRRAKTIRFLAELEVLKRSTLLFVTLTSNVGSLLRYARAGREVVDVL